jgi:hypothetical protein
MLILKVHFVFYEVIGRWGSKNATIVGHDTIKEEFHQEKCVCV